MSLVNAWSSLDTALSSAVGGVLVCLVLVRCLTRFGSCLRVTGRSTRHDPLPGPSTRASSARAEPLPAQSIMPPLRGPVDSPATLRGLGSCRVKHLSGSPLPGQEEEMTVKLDHRGWTAAQHLAPCVICHQPAILRSPRDKLGHWTWVASCAGPMRTPRPGRRSKRSYGTYRLRGRQSRVGHSVASVGICRPPMIRGRCGRLYIKRGHHQGRYTDEQQRAG